MKLGMITDDQAVEKIQKVNQDIVKNKLAAYSLMRTDSASDATSEKSPYRSFAEVFDFASYMKLGSLELDNLMTLDKYKRFTWFVDVIQLTQGYSFGELALLNNQPRAATIKCLTDCSFAVIGRADYQKCLQKIEKKKIDEKINFFRQLPCIEHWTATQIQKFMYSFVL